MATKEQNKTFKLEDWIEIDGVVFRIRKVGMIDIRVSARRVDQQPLTTFRRVGKNERTGISQSERRA